METTGGFAARSERLRRRSTLTSPGSKPRSPKNPVPAAADRPDDAGAILLVSQGFSAWLAANDCSVALTTYQAGRLCMIGRKPDGSVRAHERLIEQCQGLWTDGRSLWTSGLYALWRFENDLDPGVVTPGGVDRVFVPREGRITGLRCTVWAGMGMWHNRLARFAPCFPAWGTVVWREFPPQCHKIKKAIDSA